MLGEPITPLFCIDPLRSSEPTEGYSYGHSETRGASEGLEPIYQDLPSAVHSYDNVLYLAAQMLRSLAAGEAYLSFVDESGMHSARVQVPLVKQLSVANDTFARIRTLVFCKTIRTLVFCKSPSAIETAKATAHLHWEEERLLAQAAALALPPRGAGDLPVQPIRQGWRSNQLRK
jgi:hypothetical protein